MKSHQDTESPSHQWERFFMLFLVSWGRGDLVTLSEEL